MDFYFGSPHHEAIYVPATAERFVLDGAWETVSRLYTEAVDILPDAITVVSRFRSAIYWGQRWMVRDASGKLVGERFRRGHGPQ